MRLVPSTARQGDTVLVFVAGTRGARDVEGSLGGHHLAFFPYGAEYAALAGVDLETKPGKLPWRIGLVDCRRHAAQGGGRARPSRRRDFRCSG